MLFAKRKILHSTMDICVKSVIRRKEEIMYKLCLVDVTLIMAICLTYYLIGV